MVLQTDERLDGEIQSVGCYFLVLGWFAEQLTGKATPVEVTNRLWHLCKKLGAIGPDNKIKDPDRIIKLFVAALGGSRKRLLQVGVVDKNDKTEYWDWVKPDPKAEEYAALDWKTPYDKVGNQHFTGVLPDASEEFDPDPRLKRLSLNRKVLYRVFKKGEV